MFIGACLTQVRICLLVHPYHRLGNFIDACLTQVRKCLLVFV